MSIDLTPIFQAVIALISALIAYRLIPWIKARTTNEQQSLLKATVKTLVYAAEQIYGAGKGKEKFEYVAERLSARGYTFSYSEIEAAVKESFGHFNMNDLIAVPANGIIGTAAEKGMGGERCSIDERMLEQLEALGATQAEMDECSNDFDAAELIDRLSAQRKTEPPTEGGAE